MELLRGFGLLSLWALASIAVALIVALIAGALFGLIWFPLVSALLRYQDWLDRRSK